MRYLLFGGVEYYPTGGAHDIIGSGDSIEELSNSNVLTGKDEYGHTVEWWHIFDTETREIVADRKNKLIVEEKK